jgi:hypothetical protein
MSDPPADLTISLREVISARMDDKLKHELGQRFSAVQLQMDQRFESFDKLNSALAELTTRKVNDLREMLNERYATQTKALDAAFLAQQTAMKCVEASTPVLCADLIWRPAGSLLPGDELIAFDEETSPGIRGRSFRRAVVTGNALAQDELLLISTPLGAVKCNPAHPWLVKDRNNKLAWRRADQIKPGSVVTHLVDVWEVDQTWEGGWLAGMYDGEGCLNFDPEGNSPRLEIAQVSGPIADRLLLAIKERLGKEPDQGYVTPGKYYPNAQGCHHYGVRRRADVMKLLGVIRPSRLLEKADQVWEGHSTSGRGCPVTVISVEPAGTGTIASLSTSTGTYIAGGYAMHNTAFDAADKAVAAALQSAEKAVVKAETAAEKRFECVSSDTMILCADLIWRPAADLLPGDELIAFDEESPDRRGRRFRKSVVTANSLERDVLMRVVTPLGSVRCNYQHPWLTKRKAGHKDYDRWRWINTEDLLPGDEIMHAVDVWDMDRSWEAGWLAGMYDGEGCLSHHANGTTSQLSMAQRESETSEYMIKLLSERVASGNAYRVEGAENRQPMWHFVVSAHADVMKMLGSVRPPRLLTNSERVWEGKPLGGKHRTTVVAAVESAGTGMIARLSTSTHTYIAAGFAMHNSVNEFRAQLSDQAATFVSRQEFETVRAALIDKFDTATEQNALDIVRLGSRLDRGEGVKSGETETISRGLATADVDQNATYYKQYGSRSQISLVIAGFSGVISFVAVLLVLLHH